MTDTGNARKELERLGAEGERIGGRALPDIADDTRPDAVEVWGRRVGKTLGWAFAAFLVFQLIRTYAG
jgi:hypothetical protein